MTARNHGKSTRRWIVFLLALQGTVITSGGIANASVVQVSASAALPRITSGVLITEINAIRAKFHLPPGVPTSAFSSRVISAADSLTDPTLAALVPKTVEEDGIWGAITTTGSKATLTSEQIIDAWVYEDGWQGINSPNVGCTSPSAAGCNGHRRAVLRSPPTPGATLSIDVYGVRKSIDGASGISIAAIFSWSR